MICCRLKLVLPSDTLPAGDSEAATQQGPWPSPAIIAAAAGLLTALALLGARLFSH